MYISKPNHVKELCRDSDYRFKKTKISHFSVVLNILTISTVDII